MELVQLRIEVSTKTSAEVHYLAKRLGVSKKQTYAEIIDLFLFERGLDKAYKNLSKYMGMGDGSEPDDTPDDVPF